MRLRQVALVARDLAAATADICPVLGVEVAYRDPGIELFGLSNAVMPVGDTFLEVVSPAREGTTAGRLLERRGGDGGYMVIVQTDDLAESRRRVEAAGVRIVWETSFPDIATIHLHPRDLGGAILSLDQADPPGSWRWAGPSWESQVRTGIASEISAVEVQAEDPAAMGARWAEVLGVPSRGGSSGAEITLDRGSIRFVPLQDARGEGVSGVELALSDADRFRETARERGCLDARGGVQICGTRFSWSRPGPRQGKLSR